MEIKINQIRKEIPFLPPKSKKGKVLAIGNFFDHISFIDYMLVEHVINLYGSDQLKEKMESYLKDVSLFEQRSTVSQFIQFWPGRRDTSISRKDIDFQIRKEPDSCSFEQMKLLKKDFCNQFLPSKSELVVLYGNFSQGSVVMKLYIPASFIPSLIGRISKHENDSFFHEHDIDGFYVNDLLVYPNKFFGE